MIEFRSQGNCFSRDCCDAFRCQQATTLNAKQFSYRIWERFECTMRAINIYSNINSNIAAAHYTCDYYYLRLRQITARKKGHDLEVTQFLDVSIGIMNLSIPYVRIDWDTSPLSLRVSFWYRIMIHIYGGFKMRNTFYGTSMFGWSCEKSKLDTLIRFIDWLSRLHQHSAVWDLRLCTDVGRQSWLMNEIPQLHSDTNQQY